MKLHLKSYKVSRQSKHQGQLPVCLSLFQAGQPSTWIWFLKPVYIQKLHYAVILDRPLAILRAMTRRPPLVALRAKKPWFLLRLMVLGWYVLLGNKSIGSLDEESFASGRKNRREGRPQGYKKPSECILSRVSASFGGKFGEVWNFKRDDTDGGGKILGVISKLWNGRWWLNPAGIWWETGLIKRFISETPVRIRVLDAIFFEQS